MKKRRLGRTEFTLNPIGLGAMPLSIQGRPDEGQALKVIEAALNGGVDFIDTANAYCLDDSETGHNERLLSKAIKTTKSKEKVVIATKGGCVRPYGDWGVDASPKSLRAACDKSLKDLGVSKIDLYYLHAPDARVPFADSIGELSNLKSEGKISHIALSNVTVAQIKEALSMTRIEAVQNRCNPIQRMDLTNGVLELCKKEEIAYVAHSPVGGHRGHVALAQHPFLRELSTKYGQSVYTICLRWLLSLGENIFVIPGASKISSITDSLKAAEFSLSPEDIQKIGLL